MASLINELREKSNFHEYIRLTVNNPRVLAQSGPFAAFRFAQPLGLDLPF